MKAPDPLGRGPSPLVGALWGPGTGARTGPPAGPSAGPEATGVPTRPAHSSQTWPFREQRIGLCGTPTASKVSATESPGSRLSWSAG